MVLRKQASQRYHQVSSECLPVRRLPTLRFGRSSLIALTVALSMASLMTGCTSVNSSLSSIFASGCLSDAIELHRNRTCALKAWFRREHNFCDQPYLRDFKQGFIDGYVAIAEGKPGCPPTVPPKQYWSWAYQTAEGQAQMAAWYAGYPYGVQAAKDDGLNNFNHVNLGSTFLHKRERSPGRGSSGQPFNQNESMRYPNFDNEGIVPMPSGQAPDSSILNDAEVRLFEPRQFEQPPSRFTNTN